MSYFDLLYVCVFLQSPTQWLSESAKIQRFTQNFVGEGRRGKIQALYQLLKWMTKWRRWILIEHLISLTRVWSSSCGVNHKTHHDTPSHLNQCKMNDELPAYVDSTHMCHKNTNAEGNFMTSLSSVRTLPLVRSEMQLRVWMFLSLDFYNLFTIYFSILVAS